MMFAPKRARESLVYRTPSLSPFRLPYSQPNARDALFVNGDASFMQIPLLFFNSARNAKVVFGGNVTRICSYLAPALTVHYQCS